MHGSFGTLSPGLCMTSEAADAWVASASKVQLAAFVIKKATDKWIRSHPTLQQIMQRLQLRTVRTVANTADAIAKAMFKQQLRELVQQLRHADPCCWRPIEGAPTAPTSGATSDPTDVQVHATIKKQTTQTTPPPDTAAEAYRRDAPQVGPRVEVEVTMPYQPTQSEIWADANNGGETFSKAPLTDETKRQMSTSYSYSLSKEGKPTTRRNFLMRKFPTKGFYGVSRLRTDLNEDDAEREFDAGSSTFDGEVHDGGGISMGSSQADTVHRPSLSVRSLGPSYTNIELELRRTMLDSRGVSTIAKSHSHSYIGTKFLRQVAVPTKTQKKILQVVRGNKAVLGNISFPYSPHAKVLARNKAVRLTGSNNQPDSDLLASAWEDRQYVGETSQAGSLLAEAPAKWGVYSTPKGGIVGAWGLQLQHT
jgi:hypothetical protein